MAENRKAYIRRMLRARKEPWKNPLLLCVFFLDFRKRTYHRGGGMGL